MAINCDRMMTLEDLSTIEVLEQTDDDSISVSGFESRSTISPKAELNLLECFLINKHKNVILAGDFNTDFESIPKSFSDLLNKYNLKSALALNIKSTTKHGTFIDNIITNFKVEAGGIYTSYTKSSHDPLYINLK
ncbi:hypothetical protein A0J61_10983 [Choanephora cucurbitarum]|uniref:Endonuclease/exonuclease/phosphatase domain-containing protein n=1 Tax=Choanephora cucurbitarum TaxID=101091 RepID=A0A1C7MW26_9FUNG|nr:hypothetical protein A0J61_10983 [Choanephora cucurbitarum]